MVSANPSRQPALSQNQSHNQELKRLINSLRAWGIDYLMGESHPTSPLPATELVICLAQCEYAPVRNACIALFLLILS